MFENNPPQNLPTAQEPQDMLDATEQSELQTPPPLPPVQESRTNSDPHSGGFRFGEGGIENGPSALDAGKLRPIAAVPETPQSPEVVIPRVQTQSVPESVAGMGTAPLEESLFAKHRVLFGVLIGLVVFWGIAYGAMMLLLRDSNTSEAPKVISKEEVVAPVEQVDAVIPTINEVKDVETATTSEVNVTPSTTTPSLLTTDSVSVSLDVDGDGLTEDEEIKNGTDPKKADTDNDGLTDKEEINIWKSNPLVADTDGDGFTDGAEVKSNYSPIGTGRIRSTVNP